MKIDVYTKAVLTVIACCLLYIVVKDINLVDRAYAQSGRTVDVNLTQIAGRTIEHNDTLASSVGPSLPVKVSR